MLVFANTLVREKKRNSQLGIVSMDRRMTMVDEKRFLDRTLEGLSRRAFVSVAAFHEGRLVGNCDLVRRASRDEMHTGVLGIVIVEGYRGVGLGEMMVRTALARALEIGVWLIELEVFATNAPARSLYEKVGFKTAGVIPRKMLRNGKFIDAVQMYCFLPHKRYTRVGAGRLSP